MFRKLVLVSIFSFILLPSLSLAAVTANPTGEVTSPVEVTLSFDNFSDTGLDGATACNGFTCNYWGINLNGRNNSDLFLPECVLITQLSKTQSFNVPIGNEESIEVTAGITKFDCENYTDDSAQSSDFGFYFTVVEQDLFIALALLSTSINTFKDIAGPALLSVVAVAVLLIGAGYVWSRFKRHITMKKL
jgi:hypothetical protein